MFKCKECGAEYEIKPDYCDCGNDEFDEFKTADEIKPEPAVEPESVKTFDTKNVQPAPSHSFNNTNFNDYKRTIPVNSWAIGVFGLCIIVSLYIVFFAWNNLINSDTQVKEEKSVISKNIPSIEKIWNNAVPDLLKEEVKEEKINNLIKQIIPVKEQKITVPLQKTQNTQPKVTKVPLKKITMSKPVTQTIKTTTVQKPAQTVNTAEQAAKQKAEQERLAAEAAQLKKLKEEQARKAAEQKAKQAEASKQELIQYKANLRNTLGRKIDFTRVIGDGSCTVAFKIDQTGRLTNRSFAKQSSNNTLNDAVYKAIMSTPVYNPPPSAYNNEILNLNIRFYNGNFEISLP